MITNVRGYDYPEYLIESILANFGGNVFRGGFDYEVDRRNLVARLDTAAGWMLRVFCPDKDRFYFAIVEAYYLGERMKKAAFGNQSS